MHAYAMQELSYHIFCREKQIGGGMGRGRGRIQEIRTGGGRRGGGINVERVHAARYYT